MVDLRMGLWLNLLVFVLLLMKIEGFYVGITYLNNAVEKGAGRRMVQQCNNLPSRKKTRLGSSKQMVTQLPFSGIMHNRRKFNPDFYNWNRVKIRYCDGASFTGDVQEVNPRSKDFLAVIEDLLAKGMKNAENALLSGCSAGGLASILHCDSFRALLPMGTKEGCFWSTTHTNLLQSSGFIAWISKKFTSFLYFKIKPCIVFLPTICGAANTNTLFVLNAAYDSWQIKNILAPSVADPSGTWKGCKHDIEKCSPIQLRTVQVGTTKWDCSNRKFEFGEMVCFVDSNANCLNGHEIQIQVLKSERNG
ncbi:hypothetical protein GH714_026049 [Hevea brasiliensis]|uniref:Pectin acetylesterase n=1 Tax=Hevea brasiliensis TaxID=3981 RepID=A0A6A6M5L8_HEVBR|nr:hypothetical protein GH714_026049 [Hevea brasiliensis]